jgi:8-oxo-dGTP pyrophosphatase MutT (NUDIX family)
MAKRIIRKKILIVPYVMQTDPVSFKSEPHYVMVKDKQTNEWGFISGGVKKNETSFEAATRELQEETSGVLDIRLPLTGYTFVTSYRPPELLVIDQRRNESVNSVYTMYIVRCNPQIASLLESFTPNSEISDIRIGKFSTFQHVWSFCRDVYYKHIEKYQLNT